MLLVAAVKRTKQQLNPPVISQFIEFLTIDIKKDLYILCTSLCTQF